MQSLLKSHQWIINIIQYFLGFLQDARECGGNSIGDILVRYSWFGTNLGSRPENWPDDRIGQMTFIRKRRRRIFSFVMNEMLLEAGLYSK